MKRWGLFLAMLLSVTVLLAPATQAADEVAGRVVYHTQKVEMMEAGDVPGHIVGVLQQSGLTFYTKGPASGQIATRMMNTSYDVVKWIGSYTAYIVDSFQDGSTLIYKASGTITPIDGGNRTAFEGTYEITGGAGRFEGKKGKGSFKGERIGSPKTGGDSYADFTGTEWK
ncbi:MAG TPA: hypothetical protein VFK23_04860 [Nitrospirota bacterium]|nr:hypothetical protein [Nitrospirota bacterium]